MIDAEVVAILTARGARGPFESAFRRSSTGGYAYSVERDGIYVWIGLDPYWRDPRHLSGRGWLVSMDGELPGLIGHGRWRSLGAAVRAAERALAGRRVRIPRGRRSGLYPLT